MPELPPDGKVRPITRWGEPVMHHRCRTVESFDDELADLVADMVATLHAADGAGLAANQVGVDLRLFVFSCTDADDVLHEGVVCNPTLTLPEGKQRKLEEDDEGCLSLPGAYAPLARPDFAIVRGVDQHGEPVEYVANGGTFARCLQHEADHTEGIVFGDRLSKRWRKRLFNEHEQVAEHFPTDWPTTA